MSCCHSAVMKETKEGTFILAHGVSGVIPLTLECIVYQSMSHQSI